jgi:hypothetical protein
VEETLIPSRIMALKECLRIEEVVMLLRFLNTFISKKSKRGMKCRGNWMKLIRNSGLLLSSTKRRRLPWSRVRNRERTYKNEMKFVLKRSRLEMNKWWSSKDRTRS